MRGTLNVGMLWCLSTCRSRINLLAGNYSWKTAQCPASQMLTYDTEGLFFLSQCSPQWIAKELFTQFCSKPDACMHQRQASCSLTWLDSCVNRCSVQIQLSARCDSYCIFCWAGPALAPGLCRHTNIYSQKIKCRDCDCTSRKVCESLLQPVAPTTECDCIYHILYSWSVSIRCSTWQGGVHTYQNLASNSKPRLGHSAHTQIWWRGIMN